MVTENPSFSSLTSWVSLQKLDNKTDCCQTQQNQKKPRVKCCQLCLVYRRGHTHLDHNSIEQLEASVKLHSRALYKNHYHILGLKNALSQLYGKHAGYMIHQMMKHCWNERFRSVRTFKRRLTLRSQVSLEYILTMYALHAPLMILTIKKFEMRKISKVKLSKNLRKVALYLRDCCQILRFDASSFAEGCIRIAAEEALSQLKSWEQVVGKL